MDLIRFPVVVSSEEFGLVRNAQPGLSILNF